MKTKPEEAGAREECTHCGLPCPLDAPCEDERAFCCVGCLAAFELLKGCGLDEVYSITARSNARLLKPAEDADFSYLDAPELVARLIDFQNAETTRVTLNIPGIHCAACIWLLENLPRLDAAILEARVNFPKRELRVRFSTTNHSLGKLAKLLASIGYPPELNLGRHGDAIPRKQNRRQLLQLGVAGFAFGNTMLFSVASYLGLDEIHGAALAPVIGWLSLALSIPVLVFSAEEYWRAAWAGLRRWRLPIEAPIAIGLIALFSQSTWEVVSGIGEGYFDSLAGLIFFLLIGRVFQSKTYERLSFERDYKSFFPLAATRVTDGAESKVALPDILPGDVLLARNGDLIPADSKLLKGDAVIDYSFVTGESQPAPEAIGETLFAGGRQSGGVITMEALKRVSQSYLTSLWNQEAFKRETGRNFESVTNRFSPWFTFAVVAMACATAGWWLLVEPAKAIQAFTAVLIVACPCALALAAPFGLGAAQRVLGAAKIYLKNVGVIERLAAVDTVVFDKTGTLTHGGAGSASYRGTDLNLEVRNAVCAVAKQSSHPSASGIAEAFGAASNAASVEGFEEKPGLGITGRAGGRTVCIGSKQWLAGRGIHVPAAADPTATFVAVDGEYRGAFVIENTVRDHIEEMAAKLRGKMKIILLSGDNNREEATFRDLLGPDVTLRFDQSPHEKLAFIRALQDEGKTVMMAGDGLNDAGALKQSDVGVAVAEDSSRFTPASDLILDAGQVARIDALLAYAKTTVNVVRFCLLVSLLYNVVGLVFAAQGALSPVVCAILMPLSSITVVALASGLAAWFGRDWKTQRNAATAIPRNEFSANREEFRGRTTASLNSAGSLPATEGGAA